MIKLKRIKYCECGCGKEVDKEKRFIHGHNACKKPWEEKFSIFCKCGCGGKTQPGKKFILGHSSFSRYISSESKIKKSRSLRALWANNKERKKELSERMKGENNPSKRKDVREKISKAHKGISETKEAIETNRKAQLKVWQDIGYKKRMSEKRLKMWQNPDFKKRHAEIMQIARSKPEFKEARSKASLKNWQNPEYIKKQSGENNHNWQGGISGVPKYTKEWKEKLREMIRERDGYVCQLCLVSQNDLNKKLHVHHINYNKKDSIFDNLISLCHSCHIKTNTNRKGWENVFASQ